MRRRISQATQLFVRKFIQFSNNENRITVPLWGESTDNRWIPLLKGQ